MAGRAKENLPGGSLKYLFVYLKIRIFKCSYRIIISHAMDNFRHIIYIFIFLFIYSYAYHICRETDDFTIRTSIWLGISQPCLMTPWPCRHHVQVIEVHAPGDATVQLAFQETSQWYREPWQKGPYVDIFQFWAKYVRIYIYIYIN